MISNLFFQNFKHKNEYFNRKNASSRSKEASALAQRLNYSHSAVDCAEYVNKMKKVKINKFCKYIDDFDFEKLHSICPATKNYSASQMLMLLDFYFKNDIREFSEETLKYKGGKDLTKFLSKNYLNASNLEKFFSIFPLTDRKVGQIPREWLKNVPEEQKEEAVFRVYQAIADFQKIFLKDDENIEEFSKKISQALNREIKIEKLDSGQFGTGYKISSDGLGALCLKIFKNRSLKNVHGQYDEVQTGLFVNKHSNAFVKEFFGKIATGAQTDGFLVTQFLDDSVKPKKTSRFSKGYKIIPKDINNETVSLSSGASDLTKPLSLDRHNIKNGKIIDFGDVTITKKMSREIFDKFVNIFRGYSKYFVSK